MKSEENIVSSGGTNRVEDMWRKDYEMLIASGMAWEFHLWLTGIWNNDKERYINEIVNKTASKYAYTEDKD